MEESEVVQVPGNKRLSVVVRVAGAAMLAFLGCSGPQPLKVAIRPEDQQAYRKAIEKYGPSPKKAFFAAKAAETGRSADAIAQADAELSTVRNPFNANRDPSAVSRGAVIYQALCMRCHGENAEGGGAGAAAAGRTQDFHAFGKRFAVTLHGGAPRAWFQKISEGYGTSAHGRPAMPAFKNVLAREQIWLVITYLQSLDLYAEKR